MAMTGTLAEVSLIDLIQVVCQERHCARLTVQNELGTALIFVDAGEIVHAVCGELEGRSALNRALTWERGSFRLDKGAKAAKRTIGGSTTANLLEGLAGPSSIAARGPRLHSVSAAPRPQPAPRAPAPTPAHPPAEAVERPDPLQRLLRLPSVDHVVLVRGNGAALPQSPSRENEEEAALAAFIGNAAKAMGRALHLGELKRASVDLGGQPRIVAPRGSGFLGLHLSSRDHLAAVTSQVNETLGDGR